jgi:hypothetical protein
MMILRRMRWAGCVSVTGGRGMLNRALRKEPEGKIPFGRPGHRYEDNRKIDIDVV